MYIYLGKKNENGKAAKCVCIPSPAIRLLLDINEDAIASQASRLTHQEGGDLILRIYASFVYTHRTEKKKKKRA